MEIQYAIVGLVIAIAIFLAVKFIVKSGKKEKLVVLVATRIYAISRIKKWNVSHAVESRKTI